MNVLKTLQQKHSENKKSIAVLVDPDKAEDPSRLQHLKVGEAGLARDAGAVHQHVDSRGQVGDRRGALAVRCVVENRQRIGRLRRAEQTGRLSTCRVFAVDDLVAAVLADADVAPVAVGDVHESHRRPGMQTQPVVDGNRRRPGLLWHWSSPESCVLSPEKRRCHAQDSGLSSQDSPSGG